MVFVMIEKSKKLESLQEDLKHMGIDDNYFLNLIVVDAVIYCLEMKD